MRKLLIIFDGVRADRFAPLNLLRPSYFLRSGIVESWIHLKRCFSGYDLRFEAPAHLELMVKKHTGVSVNDYDYQDYDRVVLINGALIPDPEFVRLVSSCEAGTAFISDGDLGAIVFAGDSKAARQYAKSEHTPSARAEFGSSLGAVSDFRFGRYEYLWDLMRVNTANIGRDYEFALKESGSGHLAGKRSAPSGAHLLAPENVFIHPEADVRPGVVIDASDGPVYIDRDSVIEPHSYVSGPFYLGQGSALLGGRFTGCSIGPVCKVGGELEESVLQGYVNKHHAGYIGHSYVGEWVNFGALTTNSDLKNNYSNVRVSVAGELIDTGAMKIGSFIGDHTKFGIGSLLNTGLVVGVFCNIFGGSLVSDKEVPSFSWGSSGAWTEHKLDKALTTARSALARRGRQMSAEEEAAVKLAYERTRKSRNNQ